jgi:hypoxanthine phosphoribosyltransferase
LYPLCTGIEDLKVLLIDDVNDGGDALEIAVQHLQTFPSSPGQGGSHAPRNYHPCCRGLLGKNIINWCCLEDMYEIMDQ